MRRIIIILLVALLAAACAATAVFALSGDNATPSSDEASALDKLEAEIVNSPLTYTPKASYKAKDLYPACDATMTAAQRSATVYQIEKAQLDMTTEELCEYILNYPYWIDLFTGSSGDVIGEANTVYKIISDNFNGLKELITRDDASYYLLKKYLSCKTLGLAYENYVVEALFSHIEFFEKLTDEQVMLFARRYDKHCATSNNEFSMIGSSAFFATSDPEISKRYADACAKLDITDLNSCLVAANEARKNA